MVVKKLLFTRGCVAPRVIIWKPFSSFIFRQDTTGRSGSQAFLAETGNKNRDDFHCMQMSLVMSMWFIFGNN